MVELLQVLQAWSSLCPHSVSSGLGGALGYMLGGLDWTGTALGRAFKSQEQVLFLFASVIFIISVTLHLFSIPEQSFAPTSQLKEAESGESSSQVSFRAVSHLAALLDAIAEEDISADQEDAEAEDFLDVDRVRSKSDSVLAMPDSTVELDPDLDPGVQLFYPEPRHFFPDTGTDLQDVFKASHQSNGSSSPSEQPPLTAGTAVVDCFELNGPTNLPLSDRVGPHRPTQVKSTAHVKASLLHKLLFKFHLCLSQQAKAVNDASSGLSSGHCNAVKGYTSTTNRPSSTSVSPRARPHTFYRQVKSIF